MAYNGFGELYFSEVNFGEIKAWKKHKKMVMNLIVPCGEVKFVFFDDRKNPIITNRFQEIVISKEITKELLFRQIYGLVSRELEKKTI